MEQGTRAGRGWQGPRRRGSAEEGGQAQGEGEGEELDRMVRRRAPFPHFVRGADERLQLLRAPGPTARSTSRIRSRSSRRSGPTISLRDSRPARMPRRGSSPRATRRRPTRAAGRPGAGSRERRGPVGSEGCSLSLDDHPSRPEIPLRMRSRRRGLIARRERRPITWVVMTGATGLWMCSRLEG